jgi:hypothetical protein
MTHDEMWSERERERERCFPSLTGVVIFNHAKKKQDGRVVRPKERALSFVTASYKNMVLNQAMTNWARAS